MDNNWNYVSFDEEKFWHLCTPGDSSGILFRIKEDFIYGMNMVGVTAAKFMDEVEIFTFQLMSNHLHFVLRGSKENVISFYNDLIQRLRRYLLKQNRLFDIKNITFNVYNVKDLGYLRNLIAYVNRNGYLVNKSYTPFSYPWGANRYYFSNLGEMETKITLYKTPNRTKMEMFHTRDICFPDNYYLTNDYISPYCYCRIESGEKLFKDAHHYFSLVSRRVETFSDIARDIGDTISYTDEEMFVAALHLIRKKYDKDNITALSKIEKIEVAKNMHFEYNASNKQISRILKLDVTAVNALFPIALG